MSTFDFSAKAFFYSLPQWEALQFPKQNDVLIGSADNAIIRPGTKNIIEAPEKSFKTTMLLRLALGMAGGHTVFPSLPVFRPARILYIHGEMIPQEQQQRTVEALAGFPTEALELARENFVGGRSVDAHLIKTKGQDEIKRWVHEAFRHQKLLPEMIILDPWQAFVSGYDENSFKDVSQATEFIDKLLAEFQMTLSMPVHQGKDHARGARGHSSLAGWRDTLMRLTKKKDTEIMVDVRPRWAPPIAPFKLSFNNGTMYEGEAFSGQTGNIRKFIHKSGAQWVTREQIKNELFKGNGELCKKALQRAVKDRAITKDPDGAERFGIPWDPDADF